MQVVALRFLAAFFPHLAVLSLATRAQVKVAPLMDSSTLQSKENLAFGVQGLLAWAMVPPFGVGGLGFQKATFTTWGFRKSPVVFCWVFKVKPQGHVRAGSVKVFHCPWINLGGPLDAIWRITAVTQGDVVVHYDVVYFRMSHNQNQK